MNIKMNSIGFSYSKNIRLSEGLVLAGAITSILGLLLIRRTQQWVVASNSDALDYFETVFKAVR